MKQNFRPGDTVWCIERYGDEDESEVSGYIFVAENEECAIVSPDPIGYYGTISQYLIEETAREDLTDLRAFPLAYVFSDQEDAEAERVRGEISR